MVWCSNKIYKNNNKGACRPGARKNNKALIMALKINVNQKGAVYCQLCTMVQAEESFKKSNDQQ